MREKVVNRLLISLNNTYNYDNDTLDRVKYGLETLYISITKFFVLLVTALVLQTTIETILTILFVNGIRSYAYGLHAKKSWHCYVSSMLVFIFLPLYFKNVSFTFIQKIYICIICFVGYSLFAPADTHKRPLINKQHRSKLKTNTLLVCSFYIIIIFISNNALLNNMIILSMIAELFAINPIIYKLCDMPYDNYKTYQSN